MLGLVLLFGAVFAWAQLARGAHYASHSLWSAWLCAALAAVAAVIGPRERPPAQPATRIE
jgi:membrane-associated PAP2 superfamily phosphatase